MSDMGKLGEEVSQKVKSAIRAKLLELGINMENELPDYVMVLVANKKSQKQMEEDLNLFLGSSTTVFTSWLHSVLKKLEQVTVSSKGIKRKYEEGKEKLKRNCSEENNREKIDSKRYISTQEELTDNPEGENSKHDDADHENLKKVKSECLSDEEGRDNDCLNIEAEVDMDNTDSFSEGGKRYTTNIDKYSIKCEKSRSPLSHTSKESYCSGKSPELVSEKDNNMDDIRKEITTRERSQKSVKSDRFERKRSVEKTEKSHHENRKDNDKNQSRFEKYQNTKKLNRQEEKEGGDHEGRIKDARQILQQKINLKKSEKPVIHHGRDEENSDKGRDRKQLPSVSKVIIREKEKTVDVSVHSLVKVTPRPLRRGGIQANCNLILKAVADAEKSVATAKTIAQLRENRKNIKKSVEEFTEYVPPAKISVTLPNDRVPSTKDGENNNVIKEEESSSATEVNSLRTSLDEDQDTGECEDPVWYSKYSEIQNEQLEQSDGPSPSTDEKFEPKFLVTLGKETEELYSEGNWNEEEIDLEVPEEEEIFKASEDVLNEKDSKDSYQRLVYSKVPFNRNRLGPAPVVAVRPLQKTTEELVLSNQMDKEVVSSPEEPKKIVQMKILKRCKYWPKCLAGDTCAFHHPEIMCRMFPNCKYGGDQCIYVHPPCKYSENCLNMSCQFMHVPNPISPGKGSNSVLVPNNQLCIFYPNCVNKLCKFQHPKKLQICKFGMNCSNYSCLHEHTTTQPVANQYKWIKQHFEKVNV